MGTNGLFGFRYKKKYYMVYNNFDSYYSYLGNNLLNELKIMMQNDDFEKWIKLFLNIKIVYEDTIPTVDDLVKLNKSETDFYSLLHENQGSYIRCLQSGYLLIVKDVINDICNDNITAEFIYILDFNHKTFIISNHRKNYIYNINNLPDNLNEIDNYEDSSSEYSEEEPNLPL